MSANFFGGWLALENSEPQKITDAIAYAVLGSTSGVVDDSDDYNSTAGSWVTAPDLLSSAPTVTAVNASLIKQEEQLANAMNAQTKMGNTSAPPALTNIVYLYGNNNGDLKYEMNIPLDFGVTNYNSVQISILDNAATKGDKHGNIQVIDFGSGPFTGANTLKLMISGFFGPIDIGIRINDLSNNTSIYHLRAIVLPVENSGNMNESGNTPTISQSQVSSLTNYNQTTITDVCASDICYKSAVLCTVLFCAPKDPDPVPDKGPTSTWVRCAP